MEEYKQITIELIRESWAIDNEYDNERLKIAFPLLTRQEREEVLAEINSWEIGQTTEVTIVISKEYKVLVPEGGCLEIEMWRQFEIDADQIEFKVLERRELKEKK